MLRNVQVVKWLLLLVILLAGCADIPPCPAPANDTGGVTAPERLHMGDSLIKQPGRLTIALDKFFAVVFFVPSGLTISSWAGLVRDGKTTMPDGVRKRAWTALANWLDRVTDSPHSSVIARDADIERAEAALRLLKGEPVAPPP